MSESETVREMQREAWEIAEAKGFHEGLAADRHGTLVRLCLIHTEVSEAAQVVKREWRGVLTPPATREKLSDELADVMIRLFDLAETVGIDLEDAARHKMLLNRLRPHRYGTPDEVTA